MTQALQQESSSVQIQHAWSVRGPRDTRMDQDGEVDLLSRAVERVQIGVVEQPVAWRDGWEVNPDQIVVPLGPFVDLTDG